MGEELSLGRKVFPVGFGLNFINYLAEYVECVQFLFSSCVFQFLISKYFYKGECLLLCRHDD